MAMFNSYVELSEGNHDLISFMVWIRGATPYFQRFCITDRHKSDEKSRFPSEGGKTMSRQSLRSKQSLNHRAKKNMYMDVIYICEYVCPKKLKKIAQTGFIGYFAGSYNLSRCLGIGSPWPEPSAHPWSCRDHGWAKGINLPMFSSLFGVMHPVF